MISLLQIAFASLIGIAVLAYVTLVVCLWPHNTNTNRSIEQ